MYIERRITNSSSIISAGQLNWESSKPSFILSIIDKDTPTTWIYPDDRPVSARNRISSCWYFKLPENCLIDRSPIGPSPSPSPSPSTPSPLVCKVIFLLMLLLLPFWLLPFNLLCVQQAKKKQHALLCPDPDLSHVVFSQLNVTGHVSLTFQGDVAVERWITLEAARVQDVGAYR